MVKNFRVVVTNDNVRGPNDTIVKKMKFCWINKMALKMIQYNTELTCPRALATLKASTWSNTEGCRWTNCVPAHPSPVINKSTREIKGRPVRATIILYPVGRPVRATITLL